MSMAIIQGRGGEREEEEVDALLFGPTCLLMRYGWTDQRMDGQTLL